MPPRARAKTTAAATLTGRQLTRHWLLPAQQGLAKPRADGSKPKEASGLAEKRSYSRDKPLYTADQAHNQSQQGNQSQ